MELLVELGELANETRCFKYWSNKQPSTAEIILDEYADCMLMTMFFCNHYSIDFNETFCNVDKKDIVEQFILLYKESSKLLDNCNNETVKNILVNLIYLGYLLGFKDEELINSCLAKLNKNKERFNTGF